MTGLTTLGEKWGAVLAQVSVRPTTVTFPAEDVEDEVADESLGRWTVARPVAPALDEGQIVGDLLAWLYERNFLTIPRGELTPLQVRYFMERDE